MRREDQLMMRSDHLPLYRSEDIYKMVAQLEIGVTIPLQIYIQDYADGQIPEWRIAEREDIGGQHFILTLIDVATQRTRMPEGDSSYVGHDVIFMPTRTLGGHNYLYFPGCIHARHMFGDIRQHGRCIREDALGLKRGVLAPDLEEDPIQFPATPIRKTARKKLHQVDGQPTLF
jgi:hypothetical protein